MKIRITGLPKQVQTMAAMIEDYCGVEVNYISDEYKQNRKYKSSKFVSVYMDVSDFEKEIIDDDAIT